MEKTKISAIGGLAAIFTALLWLLPSAVETKGELDCKKDSLQAAIDLAQPGDVITVKGTCKENLVIPEEVHSITLDGEGKAKIDGGKDNTTNTVTIRGKGITIRGFTITRGRSGIVISRGEATIEDNIIKETTRIGIFVNNHSFAFIRDNTITDNSLDGISVTRTSTARIGFSILSSVRIPKPNIITGNGRDGISVQRNSFADIDNNTISMNTLRGIRVRRLSLAEINDNAINNNGSDGIIVLENSGVNISGNTTGTDNGGFGISCAINSYANGRLGTLIGSNGAKDFSDSSCVDSLNP